MLTILDENDLLTALHDGPFEQPLWSTFLERLRQRANADYAGITFRPPDRPESQPVTLFAGRSPAPDIEDRYRTAHLLKERGLHEASKLVPFVEMDELGGLSGVEAHGRQAIAWDRTLQSALLFS